MPATPQSIFYGYMAVTHMNSDLTDPDWTYNVGYIDGAAHFLGTSAQRLLSRRTVVLVQAGRAVAQPERGHYNVTAGPCGTCTVPVHPLCRPAGGAAEPSLTLKPSDRSTCTTPDHGRPDRHARRRHDADGHDADADLQPEGRRSPHAAVVAEAGTEPVERRQRRPPLCEEADPRGCWMVEERIATEEEIQYVLGDIKELRMRASYPVHATQFCSVDEADALPAGTLLPELRRLPDAGAARLRRRLLRRVQDHQAGSVTNRVEVVGGLSRDGDSPLFTAAYGGLRATHR
jgi:hypothetical protein